MPYSTDCNSSPSEFPESIVTVTLEFGPYLRADGSPVAQPISITPSVEVLDIDSGAVIMALRPVTLRDSQTQVILPATDSPGLSPIDFTYQVTVGGVPKVVSLPMAHPVVDFDLLVSSEPSPGTIIWHPPTLPSGGGDGDVLAWADVEDGGTRWMSPGEWPGVQRSEEAAHQAGEAAQRAEDARDGMVVGGTVDGDDLLLSTVGGDTIVAGNVRGQKGDPGTASPEFLAGVQAAQDAQAGAEEARDEAEQSASQADASKTAAETAQGLAEGARTGAETARTGAEQARDESLDAQSGAEQARDEAVAAAGEIPSLVADAVDELAGPLIQSSVEAQVPPVIAAQVGPVVDQAVIDADIPGRVDQAIDDADMVGTVSALVDAQTPPLIAAAVAGADIPGVVASEVGPFVAQAEAAAVAAATRATEAATSATNAGTSATAAAASATNASAAATTATTAATAATTKATEAATSAASASTSATNAAGSATTASTKAVEAATSASSASTSASSAATERTGAETARVAAEAAAAAAAQPHTHVAGDVTGGVFAPARLGSGTASVATVLRGDGSWGDVPGMGDVAAALNTILNGA